MDLVRKYIENIEFQQGGKKKPIYVEDKNDPRYKAYQDSLKLYNQGKLDEKQYLEVIKKLNLDPKRVYDYKYQPNDNPIKGQKIQPISIKMLEDTGGGYTTSKGSKIDYESFRDINGNDKNLYNEKNINFLYEGYDVYKYPKQPVLIGKNKTVEQTEEREKAQTIPSLYPQGTQQSSDTPTAPIPAITPTAQIPRYWNVEDTNKQNFGGGTTQYRITPETISNLRELPQENWTRKVTPVYQNGGEFTDSEKKFLEEVAQLGLI